MYLKKFILFFLSALFCCQAYAQGDYMTNVSTRYYGPNAFPVPDILKGTSERLELKAGAAAALGHLAPSTDRTLAAEVSARVPLWSPRVNLSVWGQFWEWYSDTPEASALRGSVPGLPLKGNLSGDLYFSVDSYVLLENEKRPGIVVRAACKSASGECDGNKRYYDAPGYFFDVSAFKVFRIGENNRLNLALTSGFLCWQVTSSGQNDAVMYGLSCGYGYSDIVDLSVDFGGYFGWRRDGDCPMSLKLKFDFLSGKRFSPYLEYQHGFMDWPYDALKLGIKMSFDILKKNI